MGCCCSLGPVLDDIEPHLGRVGRLELVVDAVQCSPQPVLGRRIQHLRPDPRRARGPASQTIKSRLSVYHSTAGRTARPGSDRIGVCEFSIH